ncbi:hypothetical protein DACRYDRAFT_112307 [Dacryopinax primogenitus]|uniref:GST N-terminal domain-containing protein n=1 Tax=Dacryopinax primogenitus (strain DJM 731) TaxID=1858805 RepID=M5FN79_DACPD|nr:uncharacterized protein DACRYDRAFT_112307 [Dacryopinax primogenitus]EJT96975.1 hypothetical protein DACRYDRAFT_112307 [Dacryopinax primogenitus]
MYKARSNTADVLAPSSRMVKSAIKTIHAPSIAKDLLEVQAEAGLKDQFEWQGEACFTSANYHSKRTVWLLKEIGVPYKIKSYHCLPWRQAPPELKAIHSLRKSPVMQDGYGKLGERGVIIEYLIKKYGKGRFELGKDGWVDNLYCAYSLPISVLQCFWAEHLTDTHFAEGSIIVMGLIFTMGTLLHLPYCGPYL